VVDMFFSFGNADESSEHLTTVGMANDSVPEAVQIRETTSSC
jgi:hypothetical protein